jgi:beta-N-acetylhexosaminidase
MGAIKKHFALPTVIRQIMTADIDIALICHKGPDIENAYAEILALLRKYPDLHAAGKESVKRILRLKQRYLTH